MGDNVVFRLVRMEREMKERFARVENLLERLCGAQDASVRIAERLEPHVWVLEALGPQMRALQAAAALPALRDEDPEGA